MPIRTLITASDAAEDLQGGPGADLIYGYDPVAAPLDGISMTRVAAGLDQPLFAISQPSDPTRLYVVEKTGEIRVLDTATGAVADRPFLDVSGEILTSDEQGLLGLAFAPDFAQSGRFYVNLINRLGDTEIREYRTVPGDDSRADPASGRVLLAVDQPEGFSDHKAGWLGFGPDGYLYAALGDGGGAGVPLDNAQNPNSLGDPFDYAQNPNSLLGKILRLDINGDAFPDDPARNYTIPADNPFVGGAGADEVWALGLRNPWRPGFDRGLGDLWIADVGQDRWEEVDFGVAGANYGWSLLEGPEPFKPGSPSLGILTPPVFAYSHDAGQSITGGTVYRGEAEALQGEYLFADFVSGRLWSLRLAPGAPPIVTERTGQLSVDAGSIDSPSSFGEDARGNLYLVDFDGEVFRLNPRSVSPDLADSLRGGPGDDAIFGGAGNDAVFGEDGADELRGQSGNDRLDGGPGNDLLVAGGDGNDTINGGDGNDTLAGDAGQDILGTVGSNGESGADHFVFSSTSESAVGPNRDVISDQSFTVGSGSDRIVVSGIDANVLAPGNQAFQFIGTNPFAPNNPGQIHVEDDAAGHTIIQLNTDNDVFAESEIQVNDGSTPAAFWQALDFIL